MRVCRHICRCPGNSYSAGNRFTPPAGGVTHLDLSARARVGGEHLQNLQSRFTTSVTSPLWLYSSQNCKFAYNSSCLPTRAGKHSSVSQTGLVCLQEDGPSLAEQPLTASSLRVREAIRCFVPPGCRVAFMTPTGLCGHKMTSFQENLTRMIESAATYLPLPPPSAVTIMQLEIPAICTQRSILCTLY